MERSEKERKRAKKKDRNENRKEGSKMIEKKEGQKGRSEIEERERQTFWPPESWVCLSPNKVSKPSGKDEMKLSQFDCLAASLISSIDAFSFPYAMFFAILVENNTGSFFYNINLFFYYYSLSFLFLSFSPSFSLCFFILFVFFHSFLYY